MLVQLSNGLKWRSFKLFRHSAIAAGGALIASMLLLSLVLHILARLHLPSTSPTVRTPALFQFGDSLSDTGNSLAAFPKAANDLGSPPFGMTFFGHPAGRNSDGRLVIDFMAEGLGLPLLEPYLRSNANFQHGVDFSTCGAPALSLEFFEKHKIRLLGPTYALDTQLEWFLKLKKAALSEEGSRKYPAPQAFSDGVYIVGEIGVNDYQLMLSSGFSFSEMDKMVPSIVEAVVHHIQALHEAGARRFIVVNVPPQGCSPGHIVNAKPSDRRDRFGCLAEFNEVNMHHNSLLKDAVEKLRSQLHNSTIAYADYYGVYTSVLEDPQSFGIPNPYIPCCGTYTNSSRTTVKCGQKKVMEGRLMTGKPCESPSSFMYWDEGHFTDHFNGIVAQAFLTSEPF